MQAVKQTMKAPEDRELRIHLPNEVPPNTIIEVILIYGEPQSTYTANIDSLKAAMADELFRQDLKELADDFTSIDGEDWEP